MYASPDSIFPINVPVIQLSHSDFSVLEIDYDAEVAQGKHDKIYDFIYVMTNTEAEVEVGCTGWGAYAKNWPLAKKAMDIMCLEMNFTGVVLGIVDSNGNSCEIPPSCQDKVVTVPYVNYFEGLSIMRQSKFLLLPQVYDASPRVAVEAMSLNVPLLMNNQIVGGWKYINEQTGEFFNDNMSDFRSSLAKLVSRLDSYSPRSYVELHYGTKNAGTKLREFVEERFSDRVSLPTRSKLLIPSEPIKMTSPPNDKISSVTGPAHIPDERPLFDNDGQGVLESESEDTPLNLNQNVLPTFVIGMNYAHYRKFLDANSLSGNDISWFPGTIGQDQRVLDEWRELAGGDQLSIEDYDPSVKFQFGPHAAGCYLSHFNLLKMLQRSDPTPGAYVVFEDDARCVRGWRAQVDKALALLPQDWDIYYIGGRPISYFNKFEKDAKHGISLRQDICTGVFGEADGPLAPDESRNISRTDPYWRAMYHVHTHAYVVNPRNIGNILAVLEGKEGHEPIDQRLSKAMASGRLNAFMSTENICEQEDLMDDYVPSWDGVTPQPWLGHFGFPDAAVKEHPDVDESHMWGRIILDEDDDPKCTGKY
jgi:GR25 family glycosyltransferase involved in LPS biosynthesis